MIFLILPFLVCFYFTDLPNGKWYFILLSEFQIASFLCLSDPTSPSRSPTGSVPCVPTYTLSSPAFNRVTRGMSFKHTFLPLCYPQYMQVRPGAWSKSIIQIFQLLFRVYLEHILNVPGIQVLIALFRVYLNSKLQVYTALLFDNRPLSKPVQSFIKLGIYLCLL